MFRKTRSRIVGFFHEPATLIVASNAITAMCVASTIAGIGFLYRRSAVEAVSHPVATGFGLIGLGLVLFMAAATAKQRGDK